MVVFKDLLIRLSQGLLLGLLVFLVMGISSSIPLYGQGIHQELVALEKLHLQDENDQLQPRLERLSSQIKQEGAQISPMELLRYFTLKMALLGKLGQLQEGLALADSVQKLSSLKNLPQVSWASFYFQRGDLYLDLENYLKSSREYEQAIRLYEQQGRPNFRELGLTYNNLGFSYDILGFQNKSKESYYHAFEIWKLHYLDDFSNISTVVNNLIFSEVEYGDIRAASELLSFFEKYVQSAKSTYFLTRTQALDLELKLLLNSSRYYGATQDPGELAKIVLRTEVLFTQAPRDYFDAEWPILASIYEEAGFLQKELKNYSEAKAYYDRMLSLPLNGFFQMKYNANVAIVWYDAEKNESALDFAQKSLKVAEKYGFEGSSIFSLKILQADLLSRLGRNKESIGLIEDIFTTLIGRPIQEQGFAKLKYADLGQLNNDRYLTIVIKAAGILRKKYYQTSNLGDFEAALALYLLAGEMFQEYYFKGTYNKGLEKLNHQIEEGILSLWSSNQSLEQSEEISLLAILEQNQSQEGWKKFLSKNEEFLGSTSEMLRERNLKNLEIEQGSPTAGDLQNLERELAQIDQRIQQEKAYRFFAGNDFDLEIFRNQLPEDLSVLKYFATDKQVFALLLEKKGLQVFQLGSLDMIRNWSQSFLGSLKQLDESYRPASQALYRLIFEPLAAQVQKKLIILPDDVLHRIPFEALLDGAGDFLVQSHQISYSNSLREMAFQPEERRYTTSRFIASFAPDYARTAYPTLSKNQLEGKTIATSLGGDAFTGGEATKRRFVETFTDYQVHHLAMHGEQDPAHFEESALIFSGGEKLLLRELYQMNFPSELVVLSACQTGVGMLMPGEGLMSLSKALSLAGVKSTVYSLWEVPDRETSELMVYFYEGIKDGLPKEEALANAKRRFLEQNPLQDHPVFWAGFVLNGKTEPLQPLDINWKMRLGGIGLLLLFMGILGFIWIKKRRNLFQ